MPLIGVGLVLLLAIGAIAFLLWDDDAPERALPGGSSQSDDDVAPPATPSFRFAKASREIVRTSKMPIGPRRMRASVRAANAARDILTDLYAEAFLDPANWKQGQYADAFRSFTRGARQHAQARPGLLTAGPRAGDRYEQIVPKVGRLTTRILLDREGDPTLMVSAVRFSALASGPEPLMFRSQGQFFFERVGASWKIVSFHVVRHDTPQEAA